MISQKKIYIWNMLGSISTAFISVVMLMVVSRYLSTVDSDIFAFGYSLGHLMLVVGLFQIRNYQATDVKNYYSFEIYSLSRLISCILMIMMTIGYILISKGDAYRNQIIFLICVYRMSDAISDLYQGLFQQRERLDIAGKSLFFRNLLSFLLFGISIFFIKDLKASLVIICIFSYLFILLYDVQHSFNFEKWSVSSLFNLVTLKNSVILMKESFPLFLNGFLIIYIYNQPKYVIESLTIRGSLESGIQTDFNILFMPAFVMNLMMLFFRPLITQMAVHYVNKQIQQFSKVQRQLFFVLFLSSVIVILVTSIIGIPLLNFLYNTNLDNQWLTLILIMIGGSIGSFATAIDNILTSMRLQLWLVLPYISAFVTSILISNVLVENFELIGAGISYLISTSVWLFISVVLYIFLKRKIKKKATI